MLLTIQEVYNCKTYNVANHALLDQTTNFTANIFEAIYNMSKRTKDRRLLHRDETGLYIHIRQHKLAECLRCCERTIRNGIGKLKALGVLAVKCIRKHASNRNFYRIVFPEKPIPGDPTTEPLTNPTHAANFAGCIQVSIINTEYSKISESGDVACPHGTFTLDTPVVDDTPPVAKTDRWLDHMPWLKKPQPQPKTPGPKVVKDSLTTTTVQVSENTGQLQPTNIPIAESVAPLTATTIENTSSTMERGRVGSLGSFISEITKSLGVTGRSGKKNPIYAKKAEIDRSTLNGAIKKIHKGILDHLGLRGIVFIETYLHTGRIVFQFNPLTQHYQAVMDDPLVKTVICMQYSGMFKELGIKII
jgi:hypothetical protein